MISLHPVLLLAGDQECQSLLREGGREEGGSCHGYPVDPFHHRPLIVEPPKSGKQAGLSLGLGELGRGVEEQVGSIPQ